MSEPLPALTRAVLAAVRGGEGPDGRLPLPSTDELGEVFPYEGMARVAAVCDPALPEPPREGEDPATCPVCARRDDGYLWVDERWRLAATGVVESLPAALLLEPRQHVDLPGLDDGAAAELGRLVVLIVRTLEALDGIGRVHVDRWGDGGAHLHVWFLARPAGFQQLRGSMIAAWLDVLPPLPDEVHAKVGALLADALVEFYGGRRPH